MSISCRRVDLAIDSLLPLFIREVTADPENQDLLRRKTRQQGLREFQEERKAERAASRAEAERRKDSQLEAKLRSSFCYIGVAKCCLTLTELSWRRSIDRVGKPFQDTKFTIRLKGIIVLRLSIAKYLNPFLTPVIDHSASATTNKSRLVGGMPQHLQRDRTLTLY